VGAPPTVIGVHVWTRVASSRTSYLTVALDRDVVCR